MRDHAQVVIIGSGGFGASTAYHLARRGLRDVVLLDRYELGSQTSPRAAGLTSKVAASELMVRLVHEALSTRAEDGAEPGVVLDVVEKGYRMSDTVIRPARVVVSA